MKQILFGIILLFLVTLMTGSVSATVAWKASPLTPVLPSTIELTEDTSYTMDLSQYVDTTTGVVNGTIVYNITAYPNAGLVNVIRSGSQLIFTPVSTQNGAAGSITFTVGDDDGIVSATKSVNIAAVNDAPVFSSTLSDKKTQEEVSFTLTLPTATDVESSLTYSLSIVSQPTGSTFTLLNNFDSTNRIITWTPAKADVGELKLRWTVTDSGSPLPVKVTSQDFTINVYPKTMCELGDIGAKISSPITIDNPVDGDEFGPGDKIPIEVTVENDAADDMDVIVKAVLYDMKTNKKLVEVESDDENINEDEDFTFNLEMQIPLDSDEEYNGNYAIYVKAYEDGNEEEQCYSDMVEIDVGRESREVIVQSMTISPTVIAPDKTVDVILTVLNIGEKDEEGVTVKLRNSDLGIDLTSDARNLGAYDKAGNSYSFRFTKILIPSDADLKAYDLEAFVLFDSGSASTSFIDSPTFKLSNSQLTVGTATTTTTKTTASRISVGNAQETTKGTLSVPVVITNTDGKSGLTVGITNADDWAQDVSEKVVSATKGQSETVYFNLKLNDDTEAGKYTATLVMKSNGNVIDSKAFTLDVTDEMAGSSDIFGSVTGSKALWIIGDIVLVVVAIFFIKLIFTGRKRRPEIKEVRL